MKKNIILGVLVILALSVFVNKAAAMAKKPEGPKKYIRVAILKGAPRINLHLRGDYVITTLHTHELLAEGEDLEAEIYPTEGGLMVGSSEFKIFGIRIETSRDASIIIDKRKFRGVVDIIRDKDRTLLAVNHVDLEEYLCGVLYHEISHLWPYEAIETQAIASRTFALYQHEQNKNKDYDLTNTAYSQVYGGATSEKYRTNKAVIKTYGKILTYKGQILPAYFHACCGGHTQDASRLWKTDLAPLKGRKSPFCTEAPHYHWSRRVWLRDMKDKLNKEGLDLGRIYALEPLGRDDSGRITEIKIKHKGGEETVSAYRFRLMLSPTLIKSTNFTVENYTDYVDFTGKGWGHGVGLCQWCAYFMAAEGYTAEEILEFFYPGTQIIDIWKTDAPQ